MRTPASLPELTRAAAGDGVLFAGAPGGGYVFPAFLPAYDAIASLCKLLELLAPVDGAALGARRGAAAPDARSTARCSARGRSRAPSCASSTSATPTANVDVTDGIKIFDARGWVQVLPDGDEPTIHLYAEGETPGGVARSSRPSCARSSPT